MKAKYFGMFKKDNGAMGRNRKITYEKVDFNNEVDEALKVEILDFEYDHLIETLRALDMEFDEIAIICRNEKGDIVGTLEYGTGVNLSEDEVYVTALYIISQYKGNKFLLNLLGYMIKDLRETDKVLDLSCS